ncbi:sigma-70 family RNA polymerase sigma factor [Planctomicrobium piriforme]|uniref:RNA polymerase sigma-70 factor, ECF subfamily n=1 Tax=Planctomicrobium piriforme TaxID=1576369 RepID=A0A1I3NLZ3_9PLAN|nr:sigma-70 family RNA polymerase sigma factor [Planctomicrobium piriforme]SFJ09796.1 RNA polymerase sigma-70 factor, ECF subfamily [Planctomicrobium piriforme]
MDQTSDEFVTLLTASQSTLYARILALLPDRVAAQDILQETNLTLWHKAEQFESGTNFLAWATRIARYHVLNYRRKMHRDRLIFDEQLFDDLCSKQADRGDDAVPYAEHLRECLQKLPQEHRDLLNRRYASGGSVTEIAASRGQTVGAVSQMLYRIRESLMNCVSQEMQEGQT